MSRCGHRRYGRSGVVRAYGDNHRARGKPRAKGHRLGDFPIGLARGNQRREQPVWDFKGFQQGCRKFSGPCIKQPGGARIGQLGAHGPGEPEGQEIGDEQCVQTLQRRLARQLVERVERQELEPVDGK